MQQFVEWAVLEDEAVAEAQQHSGLAVLAVAEGGWAPGHQMTASPVVREASGVVLAVVEAAAPLSPSEWLLPSLHARKPQNSLPVAYHVTAPNVICPVLGSLPSSSHSWPLFCQRQFPVQEESHGAVPRVSAARPKIPPSR